MQYWKSYSVPKHSHLDAHIDRALLWASAHGFQAYAEKWNKRLNYAAYVADKSAAQERKCRAGQTTPIALVDMLHALQTHYSSLGIATVVWVAEVARGRSWCEWLAVLWRGLNSK